MSTRAVTLYALALGVIAIDQLAKVLAVNFLQGQPRIAIVGDLVGLTFCAIPERRLESVPEQRGSFR